jgi:hypothetical protein
MDKDKLTKSINIILEKERILLDVNKMPWAIQIQNGKKIMIYDHADTLINLYAGLQNAELKEHFTDFVIRIFLNDKEKVNYYEQNFDYNIESFSSTVALIFFTLLQLGFRERLIPAIYMRIKNCNEEDGGTNITLVSFLNDLLTAEKRYFDIEMVTHLLYFAQNQSPKYNSFDAGLITDLKLKLVNLGYEEVKESISGVNIEINSDKAKLITIFSNNGFDAKYEKFLQEIDDYINTNSSIVSSGMISNMRSFMQDLITDLAKKIASVCDEQIPENEGMGEMGNIRNYLKAKLELSEKDNQLINKFIDILHSEGGHSFISNVEYFRLTKNIGIEICLFLLFRADNLNLLRFLPDF